MKQLRREIGREEDLVQEVLNLFEKESGAMLLVDDEKDYEDMHECLTSLMFNGEVILNLNNVFKALLSIEKALKLIKKYNNKVRAFNIEATDFGTLVTFLLDTEEEPFDRDLQKSNTGYSFTYTVNLENDFCSEFGDCAVHKYNGRIHRIY